MSPATPAGRLLLIGCGQMAGAMLARWLAAGRDPASVAVVRPSAAPVAPGVAVHPDLIAWANAAASAAPPPDIVLLGHKPQQLAGVAAALARAPVAERLRGAALHSILAGVTLGDLAAAAPWAGGVVRVMPNLPVRLGEGVVLLAAPSGHDRVAIDALYAPLGERLWLADEGRFDDWTALTGCGPAFLYRFTDALAAAGAGLGLDPAQAAVAARRTVLGAAALMGAGGVSPAALADAVASPGGMTRAGLDRLDAEDALAGLMAETLRAARDRGAALRAAAGGIAPAPVPAPMPAPRAD